MVAGRAREEVGDAEEEAHAQQDGQCEVLTARHGLECRDKEKRASLSLELSLHTGEKKEKRSHGLLGELSHDGLEPQPQRHKGEMMGPRFRGGGGVKVCCAQSGATSVDAGRWPRSDLPPYLSDSSRWRFVGRFQEPHYIRVCVDWQPDPKRPILLALHSLDVDAGSVYHV